MYHQQDHVARIRDWNLEKSNISGKSRSRIHPVSEKFQGCLKSAFERIMFSLKYFHVNVSSGFGSIKENFDSQQVLKGWYETSFLMCVIALWLDPLFYYTLVINEEQKCLRVDKKLGTIVIVLRSVIDFLYLIHVISKLRRAIGRGVLKGAWVIAKKILIDILSVLPIPQAVLLIIISGITGMGFFKKTRSLMFVVTYQFVPRVLRIYPLFETVKKTSGILIGSPALNLFLYMLACHVVGATWYLFAVERKAMCWQEACRTDPRCHLSGDKCLGNYTFHFDSCSPKNYTFGIYLEAIESGIVDSTKILKKLSYSFWFGLQSLSCLGQNLKPSTFLWEICFAVFISILGWNLLVFLIGNMQTYLQFRTVRLEEMRFEGQEIEKWMAFHSLPRNLKKRIRRHQQYKWRETRGVNVENLLHNLPVEIRRDTKHHICLDVLAKVPMLQNMDRRLLVAICDHLKQVFYSEDSCVVWEGDILDKILLITRGRLLSYSNGGISGFISTGYLEKGDFYGEELLNWAICSASLSNIPFSTKTVHTHTRVEAFTLMVNDLKKVVSKFMWHLCKELRLSPSFNLELWEHRAASALQAAWRHYYRKKLAFSGGKKLESLGTTYASRLAANALSTIQRAQEVRSVERIPPMLPQQSVEHEIIAEQR